MTSEMLNELYLESVIEDKTQVSWLKKIAAVVDYVYIRHQEDANSLLYFEEMKRDIERFVFAMTETRTIVGDKLFDTVKGGWDVLQKAQELIAKWRATENVS